MRRSAGRNRAPAAAAALGAILVLVVLFGPPRLFEYSESNDFCAACHLMKPRHESWMRMGKHAQTRCVDCHLPNRHWVPRLLRKAVDGTKGTAAFLAGAVPDPIRLSSRGRRTAQANCVRCHADMVSRIDATRACWDCHRKTTHVGEGRIAMR
ncbi:MAG: NapC/NirT family cytochrome c [Elusimicrobia bacterium]|nr:NapC/NirT family cytochrome c [Elusimicrobiota bacterium]